ncbi:MAG: hypothetical protein FWF84_05260, partial [Kiritimatiellaeota bacterium]|nr:hypothetical protein [Kiritimatiellota bacterium]
ANGFPNDLGMFSLYGSLLVSGNTGNPDVPVKHNFASNPVNLLANVAITNATSYKAGTGYWMLLRNINGVGRTLTLQNTTGLGFEMLGGSSVSAVDVHSLVVGTDTIVHFAEPMGGTTYDPLGQVVASGGKVTVKEGGQVWIMGTLSEDRRVMVNPGIFDWEGSGTLALTKNNRGGNGDSSWLIYGTNLCVGLDGLQTLEYQPCRQVLEIDPGCAIEVVEGGVFKVNLTQNNYVNENIQGEIRLFDGAVVQAIPSAARPGGLICNGTGLLTLGDGAPTVITVTGNYGANQTVFKLGYVGKLMDRGDVTMAYDGSLNVGWTAPGTYGMWTEPFVETSGGTRFSPTAGSGEIRLVGGASDTVATFTNVATLVTAGTVGFYNGSNGDDYGVLGSVAVEDGGAMTGEAYGRYVMLDAAVDAASLGGKALYDVAGDAVFENGAVYEVVVSDDVASTVLTVGGEISFDGTSVIRVTEDGAYEPESGRTWVIATFGTMVAAPRVIGSYSATLSGKNLILTRLGDPAKPAMEQRTDVVTSSSTATLNGYLVSKGIDSQTELECVSATVTAYYGTADFEEDDLLWTQGNNATRFVNGAFSISQSGLAADTLYFTRFKAVNTEGSASWSDVDVFMTGEIGVTKISDASEDTPSVPGVFRISRPAGQTDGRIVVYYAISGTADNGVDYAFLNGVTEIEAGNETVDVLVYAIPDEWIEGTETIVLTLTEGPYNIDSVKGVAEMDLFDKTIGHLVWNNADETMAWNLVDENWFDGATDAAFVQGDQVTFDGAEDGVIVIEDTSTLPEGVRPGAIIVTDGTYTFSGGDIAGVGGMTVSGTGKVILPDGYMGIKYTGETQLTDGGTLEVRFESNNFTQPHAHRTTPGPIVLDGGALTFWTITRDPKLTFTNALSVTPKGGSITFGSPGNNGFDNTIATPTLAGPLTVYGTLGNPNYIGSSYNFTSEPALTLLDSVAITNATISEINGGHTLIFPGRVEGAGYALTLATTEEQGGFSFATAAGATIDVQELAVEAPVSFMPGNGAGYNAVDIFAALRDAGGNVRVGENIPVGLGAGQWRFTDFDFAGGNPLRVYLGNQDGRATFHDGWVFADAPGHPVSLSWSVGQNEWILAPTGEILTFGAGSRLSIYNVGGSVGIFAGTMRFLGGSTFDMSLNANNDNSVYWRGEFTPGLELGDGNPETEEEISFVAGLAGNTENRFLIFGIAAGNVTDGGGVTLRYAPYASGYGYGAIGWQNAPFRGGSAGTAFAPYPDVPFIAVGDVEGPVFIATNLASFTSVGTVEFRNRGSGLTLGDLGDVEFTETSTLSVTLCGTEENDCPLMVADTFAFAPGSTLVADTPGRHANKAGWVIAEANDFIGLPKALG